MITWKSGNILEDDARAIVNPVNTDCICGKGLALSLREHYPKMLNYYRGLCVRGLIKPGSCKWAWTNKEESGFKYIFFFATKDNWKYPSKIGYIRSGLEDLKEYFKEKDAINSIAIPALGCGCGGLKWDKVKKEIEHYLGDVDADIRVYEPEVDK